MENVECDYYGCYKCLPLSQMTVIDGWYFCPDCVDRLEDSSGYCGISCMAGHGCDHSC